MDGVLRLQLDLFHEKVLRLLQVNRIANGRVPQGVF